MTVIEILQALVAIPTPSSQSNLGLLHWVATFLEDRGWRVETLCYKDEAEMAKANLEHAGMTDLVDLRIGKALDRLRELEAESAGPFDLVFIDADKPPYTEYFQSALRL